MFFAAAVEVIVARFAKDNIILEELVYLQEEMAGTAERTPVERVRGTVWGMLYTDDDAGAGSRSVEGLMARVVTVVVEVFTEFDLTVSQRRTRWPS